MKLRSSPTTSDSTSVWLRARHAAARRPPLISRKMLPHRVQRVNVGARPQQYASRGSLVIERQVVCRHGEQRRCAARHQDEQVPRLRGPLRQSPALSCRPARFPGPGCGCWPTITSSEPGAGAGAGETISPPRTRSPSTCTAASAIAAAALPAAMIHSGQPDPGSAPSASRTRRPGSTARIPACAIWRMSVREGTGRGGQ